MGPKKVTGASSGRMFNPAISVPFYHSDCRKMYKITAKIAEAVSPVGVTSYGACIALKQHNFQLIFELYNVCNS